VNADRDWQRQILLNADFLLLRFDDGTFEHD
jgi:hypothetical protein